MISNLKNNIVAGIDDIKVLTLKDVSKIISHVVSHIINCMLETGVLHDKLKIGKVSQIFKGGDQSSVQNYRPISVLPVFSKLFQRAINSRLNIFFNKYIITKSQYGFLKNKSTEQALLDMKNKMADTVQNKLCTLGLSSDFEKEFQTIQHDILLAKLEHYGIRGTPPSK